MTQEERTWNKGGYVFQYYKPGQVVYPFTNLIIGKKSPTTNNANKELFKDTILFTLLWACQVNGNYQY